jgi:hypothetical protein
LGEHFQLQDHEEGTIITCCHSAKRDCPVPITGAGSSKVASTQRWTLPVWRVVVGVGFDFGQPDIDPAWAIGQGAAAPDPFPQFALPIEPDPDASQEARVGHRGRQFSIRNVAHSRKMGYWIPGRRSDRSLKRRVWYSSVISLRGALPRGLLAAIRCGKRARGRSAVKHNSPSKFSVTGLPAVARRANNFHKTLLRGV